MKKEPDSAIHVFFFRGLSTYGHDNAKWSIFDFGPVYKHWARALAVRGLNFHPVLGMASGTPREVAARAKSIIESHPVWRDPKVPVHFLAHSAGGLVARLTLDAFKTDYRKNGLDISRKVLSLLTIASPHRGSRLAQIVVEMPKHYRGSTLLLRSLGYDVARKRPFFIELTPEAVNRLYPQAGEPTADGVRRGSVVCWAPRSQYCVPLRMFHTVKAFYDFDLPSDGVVERDTQAFGDVRAEIQVDHFRQVGLFGETRRFEQLCDVARDFFKETQFRGVSNGKAPARHLSVPNAHS